ncbi:protein kinase [Nocardia sp. NPDC051750]|uniref:serine/threonine-protein kinase n=1 Tax=Nocardia sp. NPDC051750 TaxID=3364325 RepID=UPI0037A808EF
MQAPGSEVGRRFGPYELRSLLGNGGMGEVYEAYDTVKDRVVALKLLAGDLVGDPEYQIRFRRESQAAARLAEPHIIPIHDWGVIEGRLFIDMRLVPGTDLRTILQAGGPLSPQRAVTVIEQIAAALDAAHTDGLVHRDVKPANILVTDADFAYLADFGIARHEGDTGVTQAGVAIGSYTYMAPERFDRAPVTGRADIYSLACVLHECLTGAVPFEAGSIGMLIRAHLADPPPLASVQRTGLPGAFDDVIACGMAKDPHERFATAGELAVAARDALNSPARPPRPEEPAGRSGELPATPVPPADASPPTGGIPTLVVRMPRLDDEGAPDQTTTLPAIIPGDPTSVRPTEFDFTPLTPDEPAPPPATTGIRPFPDAHLFQNEQLHPAADPAQHPDPGPATGGIPVADFYPPDQATRVYGQGLGHAAPGAEETTRIFEPMEAAPGSADHTGAETTRVFGVDDRAHRQSEHGDGPGEPGYRSDEHATYSSDQYSFGAYDHAAGAVRHSYRTDERGDNADQQGYGADMRGYDAGEQVYGAGEQAYSAHDYDAGEDPYGSGEQSYGAGEQAYSAHDYDAGENSYGSGEQSYGAGQQAYSAGRQGYGADERGYGPDAHGYDADQRGYRPGERGDGADDTVYGAGGGYRSDETPGPATGDWWTAERADRRDDPQPAPATSPGPGGLSGYSGEHSGPAAPPPDPYAAAYEAGYRDSYVANAARPPAPGPDEQRSRFVPILTGAGVFLLVVLVAVLGFQFLGSGGESSNAAESTGAAATTAAARSSASAATTTPTGTSATTTAARADLPSGAQPCTATSAGSGPYGSAAAGTTVTSCEFAEAVRQAYLDPEVVSAEGDPVAIEATSPVTGQSYTLECVAADGLVTCRGGNNAVVYLY